MDEVLKELFGGDTNHNEARTTAENIATLLGSRVVENEQIVLGEPYAPFKLSCHTKEFHCFLFISDASYCFRAKRRPKTPWAEDFIVSFREPVLTRGVSFLEPDLSKMLGVRVFRQRVTSDDVVAVAFSKELLRILRRIQFNRVQQFEFSPIGLNVVASLDNPEFCARQVSLFCELVTMANKEAYERNKDFLG
jgi:hypothetical protein